MMRAVNTETGDPWDDLTVPIVKTVRRPSVIQIVYRKSADGWTASSPELRSVKMARGSLRELQTDMRARLHDWLAPDIRFVERVAGRQSASASRTRVDVARPGPISAELSMWRHTRGTAPKSDLDRVVA